jgi:hypothetical protein
MLRGKINFNTDKSDPTRDFQVGGERIKMIMDGLHPNGKCEHTLAQHIQQLWNDETIKDDEFVVMVFHLGFEEGSHDLSKRVVNSISNLKFINLAEEEFAIPKGDGTMVH